MRVFTRVVELESFAETARREGMSPAMASKHIAHLETLLGVSLLARTTRRVRPTEAGAAYSERCIEVLRAADEARQSVASHGDSVEGALRVTAPVEFGNMHITPLLPALLEAHARLSISLEFTNRVVDLVEEGVDVALRIAPRLDSALAGRQIATSRLVLVASPAYLAGHAAIRRPDDLAKHPALCFALGRWDRWNLERESPRGTATGHREKQTTAISVQPRMRSNSSEALRRAAQQGAGIALLPSFLVAQDVRDRTLRQVLPRWSAGQLQIYALYPPRKYHPARLRAFVDALTLRFGADPRRDPF